MHSYGGIMGSEACHGLDRPTRRNSGRPGGVVRLIFCAAFLIPEGTSLFDTLQGRHPPWLTISNDGLMVKPHRPRDVFYNDLDEKAAEEAVLQLKHHSYRTFHSKVTYAAWRDIPVTYVLCELDNAISLAAQQEMIDVSKVQAAVEHINAGHSPFLSKPDIVTKILTRSAGECF
ncbi:hypothetical protein CCHL11_08118 [Colletotrichum chlorophyti]|uniref:AB hydrolase-1 domain-containing protein n=1 Tax=Colletotrichum chlorophyti TaxID=708187 RepID=A0A1Q8S1C8_9PEZI|nr:hypothetical protein CCHL11_08118 [Colletotrichum chlorophyti]